MTIAAFLITLIVIGCAIGSITDRDPQWVWLGAFLVVCVLGFWALIAFPISTYQQNRCQATAEGYGLERSDWSIRLHCRVYLPTGQLVPAENIRITSDGHIFTDSG